MSETTPELYTQSQIRKAVETDPRLNQLMNHMIVVIQELEITPAEARACAVYAATEVERSRIHTMNIGDKHGQ